MTQKGVSITAEGETARKLQHAHQQHVQILFWRKVGSITSQLIDISGNEEWGGAVVEKPVANLLFFTARNSNGVKYPDLKGYQHNLILFTDNSMFRQWQAEGHNEVLCIRISINFLKRYIPPNTAFDDLNQQIADNLPGILSATHLALTPNISAVINEILACRKKGVYRNFYLQAKVIELLVLQFEQFEHHATTAHKELDVPLYVKKMNLVRDILLDDLNTDLSLKELANKVGTNEFDLKKNFKKVFGNTVFGYLHQYKMERSKQLLLNANNKIATVAELMGYKHATHFTNAFKKYFGYLPNKLKLLLLLPWSELEGLFGLV
ncbi:helix-turn-helix transcriptional regulator [Mucilaginibacter sp. JRF]|uniref:helix-turn-helix transcriptional regulator n=1 Tax=Mucilaginibacter sp. JRF TaxID=2780088 RepID=UPI00187FB337|nr:AraC family transcriptional regulator [Mucilaginibacter sp. JRF]MBE9586397.1 helix-turn-helix transcriptional regulator [Mucilaginibacter sp. JRF]